MGAPSIPKSVKLEVFGVMMHHFRCNSVWKSIPSIHCPMLKFTVKEAGNGSPTIQNLVKFAISCQVALLQAVQNLAWVSTPYSLLCARFPPPS